mmetsp:Transcript_8251/g.17822  ORF Transcript_8251/g.17822 Transcript_8251/m.17822 type:complete len:416 (-) Transcript_8251:1669-2916(-)
MLSTIALAVFALASATTSGTPFAASSAAFAFPTRERHPSPPRLAPAAAALRMAPLPFGRTKSTVAEIEAESEELRKEIEELRREALRRLENLNERLTPSSSSSSSSSKTEPAASETEDAKSSSPAGEELLPAPAPIVFSGTRGESTTRGKRPAKTISNLLDETRWKVSLSIGREPGTWMPAEWGESGQRIALSFVAEFTPSQLYDRDDFLRGGYANAKILHVVDNEIKLGPSINEGERTYKAKDGGWQVTRGDGPMGTDLLRFFVEVDERIEHAGGDVYVPRGRVYSSCGYFPFLRGDDGAVPSVKEAFANELRGIEDQIVKLQERKDEIRNPFNLDGIKLSREIFRLNQEARKVNGKLNFAMVKEPDKGLLRFSRDGDVGLTKEGGVCCQVNKGVVVEYHILGRFSIASVDNDR